MKAFEERYELVSILGHPALFTSLRIECGSVPEGIHRYEIRHADDDGMAAAQVGLQIIVNHMGTLLMRAELPLDGNGYLDIEEEDLEFLDSGIRDLNAYMQHYPDPHKKLDAATTAFDEQKLGYAEEESVLFTPGMVDFATVPKELQALYAYEGEDRYGLRLFATGKTIPVMPFVGTYLSVPGKDSQLAPEHGECSICYREVFTGREAKMTLQEYMAENGLVEKPSQKKGKPEPER